MAGSTTVYPPLNHPIYDPKTNRVTEPWALYFVRLQSANSGNAPVDAEYIVAAVNGFLTAERVATSTATVAWDFSTAGQAKANVPDNAITFAKMQQIATQRVIGRNTAGTGNPEEVTASQVLDWIGSTRGAILERGAGGWTIITPGTSGYALVSNGAGADPSYQSVAADIQALLDTISTTQGAIIYYNGTDWVALNPGTSGQFLQTAGAAANPLWADVSSGSGTVIGVDESHGDGATMTFPLADTAEYVVAVSNAGAIVDPSTYTLNASTFDDVTFDAAPTAGNVLTFEYVIAQV